MAQKILIFKIFFLILLINCDILVAKTITGEAKVIDGDTIHINQNKIRLYGIDAPEVKQTCLYNNKKWDCGRDSKLYLEKLILNKIVKCNIIDIDKYNRFIGVCFLNNTNLNKSMVKNGWAIAYRYYSKKFINAELIAKKNKSGIWKGSFEEPYKFRKKKKK